MLQRLETDGFRESGFRVQAQPAAAVGPASTGVPHLRDDAEVLRPVLRRLGLTRATVEGLGARARHAGSSFIAELLAAGLVGEEAFYATAAETLGLRFVAAVDPARLIVAERLAVDLLAASDALRIARFDAGEGKALQLIAPDARQYGRLAELLAARPALRERMVLTSPAALRAAMLKRLEPLLAERAVNGLAEALPYCSARTTFTPAQAFWGGAAAAAAVAAAIAWPAQALLVIHLSLLAVFVPCVALRLLATRIRRPPAPDLDALPPHEMPRYTVLVALHREAEIVPELLVALGRLEWPRAKLEIKLVCEADDAATLDAIAAQRLRPCVEVVRVPAVGPRTKPKALAYAMQISGGDLVALYDAEDRPHPRQLLEAWSRFRASGPELACVQAPLVVSNRSATLIARMFAFEYSGLFRAMLPFLSRNRLILPLGGTSNHFRRRVLDKVGGWDPFNVTEDADLGLRLKRFGYSTETITLPTLEAAPVSFGVWLPQRTRWFKGWAQTWLVHMRHPTRLVAELGPASFAVSQILFAGMILSALAHPLLFVTMAMVLADAAIGDSVGIYNRTLLGIDLCVVGLGYLAFVAIGARGLPRAEWRMLPLIALATPLYWLMLSLAAWRAITQLLRAPHLCGLMYQTHQAFFISAGPRERTAPCAQHRYFWPSVPPSAIARCLASLIRKSSLPELLRFF
jgi:cellulose synthase/poly-beta-1,6-N-acetylglucosamine synthase-like glycosyltransferase